MTIIEQICKAIETSDLKSAKTLVQQAIDEGVSAQEILNDGLVAGMSIIGARFARNEAFIPEVLVSAKAMNKGIELIKPLLLAEGSKPIGKVCIGTVQGDKHDIGKNIVKLLMEGRNIEVIDLGVDVAPERFVNAVKEHNCDILCLSSLLSTTMPMIPKILEALEAEGLRDKVTVMIGGAPVSQDFCDKVGADVYAADGASAAERAAEILAK